MRRRIALLIMAALLALSMAVSAAGVVSAGETRKCGPDRTQNQGHVCVKGGGQPFFSPRGQA